MRTLTHEQVEAEIQECKKKILEICPKACLISIARKNLISSCAELSEEYQAELWNLEGKGCFEARGKTPLKAMRALLREVQKSERNNGSNL